MNKFVLRVIIQISAFIAAVLLVILAARFVAHRYCPYAVVCFGVRGLHPGNIYVFTGAIFFGLLVLLSTLFIGRRFCGYLCPLGSVVEYLNRLNPWRKKFSGNRVPLGLERRLRIVKYLVLTVTALVAFFAVTVFYYYICPVMLTTLSIDFTLAGIIILVFIAISAILIHRFWCRYLCPLAALMNCFQFLGKKIGIKRSRIYRNLEICTDCLCCEYNCQMNIQITDREYIEDLNCIYCLNCIKVCPKEHCLRLSEDKHA